MGCGIQPKSGNGGSIKNTIKNVDFVVTGNLKRLPAIPPNGLKVLLNRGLKPKQRINPRIGVLGQKRANLRQRLNQTHNPLQRQRLHRTRNAATHHTTRDKNKQKQEPNKNHATKRDHSKIEVLCIIYSYLNC